MCELTSEELWLVVRLYAFALSPVFLGLYYLIKKNISYNTCKKGYKGDLYDGLYH